MSYKIDSHKLESVTKSLFYDPTWTRESGDFRNLGTKLFIGGFGNINIAMEYLSTDGKVMTNVNNLLSDEQNEQFVQYGEHRFSALWSLWKYIKESPKEEEDIKLCFRRIVLRKHGYESEITCSHCGKVSTFKEGIGYIFPHTIEESIGSLKSLGEFDLEEFNELCYRVYKFKNSQLGAEEMDKSSDIRAPGENFNDMTESGEGITTMNFMLDSRMVRLNLPSLIDVESGSSVDSLNIMSYYPLTHSQRRFLLDHIEMYHISPDRVFIDDFSEQQSIKRQLGLQFF